MNPEKQIEEGKVRRDEYENAGECECDKLKKGRRRKVSENTTRWPFNLFNTTVNKEVNLVTDFYKLQL